MSTAYSSAKQQYIGNGVTTEWGFDFPIKKHSELKVYLKRSGLTQVLLEEGVDYSFVTENTIAFPIKTGEAKLQAADVLALQRESVFESEYNFSNQQRLEPEEVMHADDNLERQIQELKRDVTQAIRIQPTSNINTDEYFIAVESIYENLDNITNVSGISAEIVNCSDNISDISTVSSDIANVNAVVQSISDVNTVAGDISSVNVAATNIEFIKSAEGNANDAKNSKIEAQNSAVTAQLMATQAQDWAIKTDGKVDGTNYSSKYYAGQASNSANNSHIWAEGTDAQVQALGGVHSSKGWAEQSTNANIALTNSPYTTNRILEIPQDIKLELNNGTLTLKAGSKVYAPNGFESDGTTPKFDVRVIESDINYLYGTANTATILLCGEAGLEGAPDIAYSGPTAPSVSGTLYALWYDTANNLVKVHGNGWDEGGHSLPIGIVHRTINVGYDSIDQVFNGFGYIGSTVFALPGVKVQIPNGRNEDGTCKNIIWTNDSVKIWTQPNVTRADGVYISSSGLGCSPDIYYDSEDNINKNSLDNTLRQNCKVADVFTTSGKISSFTPCTVDSVVNSNASNFSQAGRSYLSGLGMPSAKNIKLTVGASGTTYTAPANGWFYICVSATENGALYNMYDTNAGHGVMLSNMTAGLAYKAILPIIAGHKMYLSYSNVNLTTGVDFGLWFNYAQGDQ